MANYPGTATHDRPGTGYGQRGDQSRGGTGVVDKAQQAVGDAVETAKDWASNVGDKAKELGSSVASGTGRAYDAARDVAVSAEQSFEACVRRHPMQSMLCAFGIGCLVGLALRRD